MLVGSEGTRHLGYSEVVATVGYSEKQKNRTPLGKSLAQFKTVLGSGGPHTVLEGFVYVVVGSAFYYEEGGIGGVEWTTPIDVSQRGKGAADYLKLAVVGESGELGFEGVILIVDGWFMFRGVLNREAAGGILLNRVVIHN